MSDTATSDTGDTGESDATAAIAALIGPDDDSEADTGEAEVGESAELDVEALVRAADAADEEAEAGGAPAKPKEEEVETPPPAAEPTSEEVAAAKRIREAKALEIKQAETRRQEMEHRERVKQERAEVQKYAEDVKAWHAAEKEKIEAERAGFATREAQIRAYEEMIAENPAAFVSDVMERLKITNEEFIKRLGDERSPQRLEQRRMKSEQDERTKTLEQKLDEKYKALEEKAAALEKRLADERAQADAKAISARREAEFHQERAAALSALQARGVDVAAAYPALAETLAPDEMVDEAAKLASSVFVGPQGQRFTVTDPETKRTVPASVADVFSAKYERYPTTEELLAFLEQKAQAEREQRAAKPTLLRIVKGQTGSGSGRAPDGSRPTPQVTPQRAPARVAATANSREDPDEAFKRAIGGLVKAKRTDDD